MTVLTLPYPPAVNNLFATVGKHRIRTRRYEAWLAEASAELYRQRPQRVAGGFRFTLVAHRPDRRKRDLDGLAKAPLDLLVKAGVIEDDSLAASILLSWSESPPQSPGSVRLTVEAA